MANDLFTALGAYAILALGLLALYLGISGLRQSKRLSQRPKRPTYSKSANPDLRSRGIFVEHGMVENIETGEILPDSKPSAACRQ